MLTSFITTFLSFILISPFGIFADATASDNLSGYAWAPNSGWVSFNCTTTGNCGAGAGLSDYGATVGASGTMSGYAWSSNLGWITFNTAELAGCPSGTCEAKMSTTNGEVSGWARACSVFASGCSGVLKDNVERGDWEGWISLRDPRGSKVYGVLANGTKWTGYAWGGGNVTGTGNWDNGTPPAEIGGNATTGWVSFRGFTTGGLLYGVDGTGNAEGPRSISCGVNKQQTEINTNVTWTVVIDAAKVAGPYTFDWGGNDGPTDSCSSGCTNPYAITKSYPTGTPNPKTAYVLVNANGVPYIVDCDAAPVTGSPTPWYADVTIGDFDVEGRSPTTVTGTLEATVSQSLSANIRNNGTALSTPFPNRFEINHPVDPNYFVDATSINSIAGSGATQAVTANWTPDVEGTYQVRVCADQSNGNPGGVIDEGVVDETNNCTATWTTVIITEPPVLPLGENGVTCRPTPSVVTAGRTVRWDIVGTPSGGTPPYTYDWTFTGVTPETGTSGGGGPTYIDKTYTTTGTKTATIVVHSLGDDVPPLPPITCSVSARVQIFEEF